MKLMKGMKKDFSPPRHRGHSEEAAGRGVRVGVDVLAYWGRYWNRRGAPTERGDYTSLTCSHPALSGCDPGQFRIGGDGSSASRAKFAKDAKEEEASRRGAENADRKKVGLHPPRRKTARATGAVFLNPEPRALRPF